MTKLLTIICLAVLVCGTSSALAQNVGQIGLFVDRDGINCRIVDGAGIVEVHVVVLNAIDLAAVQFRATKPDCWVGATWVADQMAYPVALGDTQVAGPGMSVGFGQCLDSPVYVGTIVFVSQGLSEPCCEYAVTKAPGDLHPEIPGVLAVTCIGNGPEGELGGMTPLTSVINGDSSCDCMGTVATEEVTWGAIKSAYR